MKLAASTLTPGSHWLILRAVEATKSPKGPALRWSWATTDGEPFTSFTSQKIGQGSNARIIAETLSDAPLNGGIETDDLIGLRLFARIIPHPLGDWRMRIAEVRSPGGRASLLVSKNGLSWDEVKPEDLRL